MMGIYIKEINAFFSGLMGYLVIGVFLILVGSFMWIFSDTSILDYNFATMDQLFSMGPLIFLFLIPAITMRSFAEERQDGTLEFLLSKPIKRFDIVLGKFLANLTLVAIALLPTLIYYYSVYQLGAPKGNLDTGAIVGSYIGLFFLAAVFISMGMFASALSKNQVIAFIFGALLCFIVHWAFTYLARMPIWDVSMQDVVQKLGIDYHYLSINKGAIDSRDILYFLSVTSIFFILTLATLKQNTSK